MYYEILYLLDKDVLEYAVCGRGELKATLRKLGDSVIRTLKVML